MNMIFRLIYLLITTKFRKPAKMLDTVQTPFRVCITDLDLLRHMNNGKYFSLMDLARIDLMLRSGTYKILKENGIFPVVVAETIHFKKSLKLLNAFYIETKVLGWDEKHFFLEQEFFHAGESYARALVSSRMLKGGGVKVTPSDCLTLVGSSRRSPDLPAYLTEWLASANL